MTRNHLYAFLFLFFILLNSTAQAQDITWKESRIPTPGAGSKGLEAILAWPNTPGKHPILLISHGSPRDTKQRTEMTAISSLPIAMEFARRGFAVAIVMRRGYGTSGGQYAEGYNTCSATNYPLAASASAADLRATLQYLATLPQFDPDKIVAVGVSAGGFATVALTAKSPPKGLVAAISFAGGRGSTASDTVCDANDLVSTFGSLGKTSRTPMLWVYAENDHFFNPALAHRFYQAFTENGGQAQLIMAPAYGKEGHYLFSNAGIPVWTPIVEQFLKSQHLVLLKEPLPLPAHASLKAPRQLSAKNLKEFQTYLISAPHKAFAIDSRGSFGWRSGRLTIEDAKEKALSACKKYAATTCELYAVDDDYART